METGRSFVVIPQPEAILSITKPITRRLLNFISCFLPEGIKKEQADNYLPARSHTRQNNIVRQFGRRTHHGDGRIIKLLPTKSQWDKQPKPGQICPHARFTAFQARANRCEFGRIG